MFVRMYSIMDQKKEKGPEMETEKLLTEFELAVFLALSVATVRRNRSVAPHRLPPWVKFGSSVRWRMETVQKWLTAHEVGHESFNLSPESDVAKVVRRGRPSKAETVRAAKNANK